MSKKLPSIEQGLQTLLEGNQALAPATDSFIPAKEFANNAVEQLPEASSIRTLQELRDQVHARFGSSKVGDLMNRFVVNRDTQLRTLIHLGKEPVLDLIAQGALPSEIADAFEISYSVFNEFVAETCTDEEVRQAERLGADSMISQGLKDLEQSADRDEVAKYRALLEAKWKLAKSLNHKYIEQKPSTAVQVNNYGDGGSYKEDVPLLQIVALPDELPPLTEYKSTTTKKQEFEPEGFIDGEFQIYSEEDNV